MFSSSKGQKGENYDLLGLTQSQRLKHDDNRSRGQSIVKKMNGFLLQFDDYNYKMLNDDLKRVVQGLRNHNEQYNHHNFKQ